VSQSQGGEGGARNLHVLVCLSVCQTIHTPSRTNQEILGITPNGGGRCKSGRVVLCDRDPRKAIAGVVEIRMSAAQHSERVSSPETHTS
jgi:hypothetical protein